MIFENKLKISEIFALHLHLWAAVGDVQGLFGTSTVGVDNDIQKQKEKGLLCGVMAYKKLRISQRSSD